MTSDEARLRFFALLDGRSPQPYEELKQAFKHMAYSDSEFLKAYEYAKSYGVVERNGAMVSLSRKALDEGAAVGAE